MEAVMQKLANTLFSPEAVLAGALMLALIIR
jgi:hypothetical protein